MHPYTPRAPMYWCDTKLVEQHTYLCTGAYIHAYVHAHINTYIIRTHTYTTCTHTRKQQDGIAVVYGTAEADVLINALLQHSIKASRHTHHRLSQEVQIEIHAGDAPAQTKEQEQEERFKRIMKNVSLVLLTLQNCIIIGKRDVCCKFKSVFMCRKSRLACCSKSQLLSCKSRFVWL
jgi:hypothetical protein